MGLFYITGTSGSGKSSVCNRLVELGYEALDTDSSINEWHDKRTGDVITFPHETLKTPSDTTKWVQEYDFLMPLEKIKQLATKALTQNIFICGHASNDIEMMNHFQRVFCLLLDEEETRSRLLSRTNNKWGNDPEQLAQLMKWYKPTLERYKRVGAIMIDAALPLEEVVNNIIELSNI